MKRRRLRPPAVLAALLALCMAGCAAPSSSPSVSSLSTAPPVPSSAAVQAAPCFFEELAAEAVGELGLSGGESELDKVRLAYRYVIEKTSYIPLDEPQLTDCWQYLDHCGQPPTFYQVLATSPLLFGIGSCENYAAALLLLLEEMGFAVQYVPGSTLSVEGQMVDHAWAMVEIDGNWYHIDPQLEDNVTHGPLLQYRYFLKSDEEFAAHHLWGARLPNPDEYSLSLPACPRSAPVPPPEELQQQAAEMSIALAEAAKIQNAGVSNGLHPQSEAPPFPNQMPAAQ